MNGDCEEAFVLLWRAIEADERDLASEAVVAIDIDCRCMHEAPVQDFIFEEMLKALGVAASGECSWHIFVWFERYFYEMTDEQRERTWRFVSSDYGRTVDDATVLEIAEWVGGFRSDRALKVVRDWIDNRASFPDYNEKCIRIALSEFLNDEDLPVDAEWRRKVLELSQRHGSR
jgi:hypothetical protein